MLHDLLAFFLGSFDNWSQLAYESAINAKMKRIYQISVEFTRCNCCESNRQLNDVRERDYW